MSATFSNVTKRTCQLSGIDENPFIDALAKHFITVGYKVRKQYALPHGVVDLALISSENILTLYECKISAKLGDIAQALGQLLIYRAQFKNEKFQKIRCTIMVYDCMDTGTYNFLRTLCQTYGVILSVCKRCESQGAV